MIRSGFFNSINGDRRYDAKRFAEYFATFIGNGVFPNPSTNFQVLSNDDMTVTVRAGRAWINGYICINDDNYILEIDPADGVLNRVDRIVLHYDNMDREIRLEVKKGVFASNPIPKSLQRDVDAYEICLAEIRVNKGAIRITQASITDTRLSKELCGIVHGLVDQVDTEVLFQDYLSWINQKKDEFNTDLIEYRDLKQGEIDNILADFKSDFIAWFNTIQDILDENVAGNLLSMINNLRADLDNFSVTLPLDVKSYDSVSQWADILIPDADRGKALLEFLLTYMESSEQITSSEQAMLVIMQEERFDKGRQVPFDYDQIIFKLGQKTEVGLYLAWIEELLSDHTRGIEKLELGLMLEQGSSEIVINEYAMRTIMKGEEFVGLTSYRRKLANKEDVDREVNRLDTEVTRVDNRLTSEVNRLTIEIDKKANK